MNPLITCGITAFNAEDTIERAVRSALHQKYRPIEIVVVDDVSTDSTLQILDRLANAHAEIRIFRQEKNGGVAMSRGRIILEAKGAFIAFFDDDDVSVPERLDAQLRRILDYEAKLAAKAPVICHTARRVVYPDGHEQIWRALGANPVLPAPRGPEVARVILGVDPMSQSGQEGAASTCSQMARRSTYHLIGGFDAAFRRSEDCDFAIRAALNGAHFVGLAEPLVVQSLTSSADKNFEGQHHYGMMLLEKHRQFLSGEHDFQYARCYYEARYAFMAGRYIRFAWNIAIAVWLRPSTAFRRLANVIRNAGHNRRMGRFYTARTQSP